MTWGAFSSSRFLSPGILTHWVIEEALKFMTILMAVVLGPVFELS